MYEKTTSSSTYMVPECCCSCLGPANKLLLIASAKEWTHEGVKYRQSYTLDVPICSACKIIVYKRRLRAIGLFLVVLALAWLVWQQQWNEWEIWLTIGIVASGLIALCVVWFTGLPAEIEDNGLPIFRSGKYQELFERLNGLDRSRYEHYEFVEKDR